MPQITKNSKKFTPLSRVQKLIASRMSASKKTKPCYYMEKKADLTDLAAFRKGPCRKAGIRAGTNDFIIAAMAKSALRYPLMTAKLTDSEIQIAEHINICFAVDSPSGLVTPVVKNCETKNLQQIASDASDLIKKARNSKLSLEDLSGANLALSALGMFGIDSFIAIAPPETTGIISIGRIIDYVRTDSDGLHPGRYMSLTLAADSMTVNPHIAAAFLEYTAEILEQPQSLIS